MKNRRVAYAHYITDILIFLSDLIDGLLLWAGNQVHLNLKQVCHVFFLFLFFFRTRRTRTSTPLSSSRPQLLQKT